MCFNWEGAISTLNGGPLKLVDKFKYFGCSVSSIENDVNKHLAKVWTTIGRLSITWKFDLSIKMKQEFFEAVFVSVLLYGYTTWTLTKYVEEKASVERQKNAISYLEQILESIPVKQQLYDHLPPISKTIQVRWTRYMGHCWRRKDELISDILLWTPFTWICHIGQPARTYLQQPLYGYRM